MTDDPAARAAELRTEIEEVRADLGDTAEALAAKTDVKTRARAKADELKQGAQAKIGELKQNPAPAAIAAGAVVAVLAIWLVRRRSA